MTDEKLWLLVSLQLSGEATTVELKELDMLKQQDPLLAGRTAVMERIWLANAGMATTNSQAMPFDRHLQRLSNHLGTPVLQFDGEPEINTVLIKHRPKFLRKWWWLGGSIAACVVLSLFFVRTDSKENLAIPKKAANTVSTRPGSKSKIELPDGTQVWLNADSKLEYSGDFSGRLREVKLSGEAYFDVVKDKSRPFIIHTSTVQVKVLGTAFNVRSYPSDKTTETALIRGSVEVTLNGQPDKKVILKPNEKVVIDNASAEMNTTANSKKTKEKETMLVSAVHLDKKDQEVYETMWVKNKLAFDETPFDDMIAEIERWYNVTIIVKNKALSSGTYTVTFENKTLDEVMEGLQFSAHFQYQLKDGVVTIL
jgi:ferric-dicitrate binding protein FerR (iron transport regulator)